MQEFQTPRGNAVRIAIRGDTNDAAMAHAILSADEYRLREQYLSGWALDIGSHIGSAGLALAADNPDLSVICVEPVPENCDVIRQSITANALGTRVFVEEGSAGAPGQTTALCRYDFTDAETADKGGIHDSRWVGNLFRGDSNPVATELQSPVVTIRGLADKYEVGEFAFCKIDCEGCEYAFFAEDAGRIALIIGEWHDGEFSRIEDVLSATHSVEVLEDHGGVGLFQAVRR
jgi:FkbM family methyltransferase